MIDDSSTIAGLETVMDFWETALRIGHPIRVEDTPPQGRTRWIWKCVTSPIGSSQMPSQE
jgi:hypothetical protein